MGIKAVVGTDIDWAVSLQLNREVRQILSGSDQPSGRVSWDGVDTGGEFNIE